MRNAPFVADVIDPVTNERYDRCWTWEAGQTYAREGYLVQATAADGFMGVKEAQSLYDYERRLFMDLYNRSSPWRHA